MQDLYKALRKLVQEEVDFTGMDTVVRSLVRTALLEHKDKGVRIYVACCLADVFRLYASRGAPALPFNDSNIKVAARDRRGARHRGEGRWRGQGEGRAEGRAGRRAGRGRAGMVCEGHSLPLFVVLVADLVVSFVGDVLIADLVVSSVGDGGPTQSIFELFAEQIDGLGNLQDTYGALHRELLESLATFETCRVLFDDNFKVDSDEIVLEFFRRAFDAIQYVELGKTRKETK